MSTTTTPDLRFALAGTGEIARHHAAAIAHTRGCRLVAVLSRDRARAEALATRFGARAATDALALLADDGIDAVAICTEHDRLAPLLRAAGEHGKHVLVEKPLARNAPEGHDALAACGGVVVACAYQRRLSPAVQALRATLHSGELGRVLGAEASMVWRRDGDYFARAAWRAQHARAGGGALLMQGIHYLDLLRHLVGDVERVTAESARVRALAEVEDSIAISLRFRNGALGSMYATTAAAQRAPVTFAIHAEHGSLRLEGERVTRSDRRVRGTRRLLERLRLDDLREHWRARAAAARPGQRFGALYADFVHAVRTGSAPVAPGGDALATLALADAVYRAAATGTRIHV